MKRVKVNMHATISNHLPDFTGIAYVNSTQNIETNALISPNLEPEAPSARPLEWHTTG